MSFPTVNDFVKLWEAAWKWLVFPITYIAFLFATNYLNAHYVEKAYFDKAVASSAAEKAHVAEEQKAGLQSIATKLDALLLRDSANAQRFNDYDRRLDKVEAKIDRITEKGYSPNAAH